ncbi:hypothetical protein QQM39_27715 [Streptomyces sp. DT2A-34]|uniref:hypothetical protein n=1 Tax=Streptomyces sp. DT2A-34 TaxID=3051182 RepID=UPI00265C83B4|nr:hypothetical protein [Streptomyces sp. DT2A-34]MDO0914482.1 hypothetical protein [Streptomyces sp. DT2A-34]
MIAKKAGKFVAAAAILGAFAGASPAVASAGEDLRSIGTNIDGSIAIDAYSWKSAGNKNVAIKWVSGTHSAYTEYDRVNTHGLRLDNDNKGTTKYSGSSTSNYVQKVTACWDIAGNVDDCGPDDRPGDGR